MILRITRNQKLSYHKLCYTMPLALHHRLMLLISGKFSRFLYANSSEESIIGSKSDANAIQYGPNANEIRTRVPMPLEKLLLEKLILIEIWCQCHLVKLALPLCY